MLDLSLPFTLGSVQFILSDRRIFRFLPFQEEPDLKIKVKAERFVVDSKHLGREIFSSEKASSSLI